MGSSAHARVRSPSQVIAIGESEYDDGVVAFRTAGSQGLFSNVDWRVTDEVETAAAT
jgi:hypothetical protein